MVALQHFFDSTFPFDIDGFFNHVERSFFRHPCRNNVSERISTPNIDLAELPKAYALMVDVPGYNKEELSLTFINENTLCIKGHREMCTTYKNGKPMLSIEGKSNKETACVKASDKSDTKESEVTYWCHERGSGSFSRTVGFPTNIDKDNVKANLKDGVLYVNIPKATSSLPKKITIN